MSQQNSSYLKPLSFAEQLEQHKVREIQFQYGAQQLSFFGSQTGFEARAALFCGIA
jgi:hypothetical protein